MRNSKSVNIRRANTEVSITNMEELTNFSEWREFIELKPFEPKEPFNGFIVIPRVNCELHSSGYRMIKIALTNHGRVVGCVEGCTDVIHLNGIGGYGKYGDLYTERVKTRQGPIIDWSIDVAPNGLVRVFCSYELEMCDFPLSDLMIYLKEVNNEH